MERPPQSLKAIADRLSELLYAPGGVEMKRLLWLTGFLTPEGKGDTVQADQEENPDRREKRSSANRIGIWEQKSESGKSYYVRSKDMAGEWSSWASVGRIDLKKSKRRVVLIGESVARGYLYDPLFTPAIVLEKVLQRQLGRDSIDVIDLARTNLEGDFDQLAIAASELDPDAVVIFAGNNWRHLHGNNNDPKNIREIVATLLEQGGPGLKRLTERKLEREIRIRMERISTFYKTKGVPVLWVVPEFNLGDWRDPDIQAPYLKGEANQEWVGCQYDARRALQIGEIEKAAELAGRMIGLDEGASPVGLYILAECSQYLSETNAVREYLELARDATLGNSAIRIVSPRPYSIVQDTLRRESGCQGNIVVDLPKIFYEHLNGELPDRRLFIDYCHLSSEGVQIAMASIAASLLHTLDGMSLSWKQLIDKKDSPSDEVEAEVAFLAAIHNAHWWQSQDLVTYYCSRAIGKSPKISEVMTQFVDMQIRRTPLLLCRSAERISDSDSPLIRNYLLRDNHQQLDRTLVDSIVSALAKVGVDVKKQVDHLRMVEHSVSHKDIDLLEYYYCASAKQPLELTWKLPNYHSSSSNHLFDYYRAFNEMSSFVFVADANHSVTLNLTCRLPGEGTREGKIIVEINGRRLLEEDISSRWANKKLTIHGEYLQNGINKLGIHWPLPKTSGDAAIAKAVESLMDGRVPDFSPIYGEIHEIKASSVRDVSLRLPAGHE
jgi:hypothetical protein